MRSNIYIFEGPDMSGKSTQLLHVKEKLIEHGLKVATFKFPDKNNICGKETYNLLNKEDLDLYDVLTLTSYDFANKAIGMIEKIMTASKENDVVLIDRFILSAMAYHRARVEGLLMKGIIKRPEFELLIKATSKSMQALSTMINVAYKVNQTDDVRQYDFCPLTFVFLKNKLIKHLMEKDDDEEEDDVAERRFDATDNNVNLQHSVSDFYSRLFSASEYIRNPMTEYSVPINLDEELDYAFGDIAKNKQLMIYTLSKVEDLIVRIIIGNCNGIEYDPGLLTHSTLKTLGARLETVNEYLSDEKYI